jgi:uncharacterized membrane protein
MAIVRFLMLLSLVVWIGGIIFFAFVLAPTVFAVLPTRALAGTVVNRALPILHWMGLIAGIVFLATSIAYSQAVSGNAQIMAPRHLLVVLMIVLTLVSQFGIGSKLAVLRAEMGDTLDRLPHDDARRVRFNKLHVWSTRLEGSVLFLGLAVLFLTARRLS